MTTHQYCSLLMVADFKKRLLLRGLTMTKQGFIPVTLYRFPALIFVRPLGWLENTKKSAQPIFYLYWKEGKEDK